MSEETERYALHGVRLDVVCDDSRVRQGIDSRLRCFRTASVVPETTFRIDSIPVNRPTGPSRTVYDAPVGEVRYFEATDELFIDYDGDVQVRASFPECTIHTAVLSETERSRLLATHPLFTIPLLEVMKRRNRFPIHAACMALGASGLLLPGGSGAGKSTLAIALLEAGLAFLGDDIVWLTDADPRPNALAFPDELDVTDDTARMFPDLSHLVGRHAPRDKHQVRVEDVFAVTVASACVPVALVFPEVAGTARSSLVPVEPSEALVELAPNVLLTDPETSRAHFDILGSLARSVPAFRLRSGTDVREAARALTALLRRLSAT